MRDALNFLATAQALTTEAVSENDINLASAGKQMGLGGRPYYMHILVTTLAGGMASGGNFEMVDDDAQGLGSHRVIQRTNQLAAGDLAAGAHIVWTIPPGVLQQYLGWNWKPVNEASTGLVVDSWIDNTGPDELTIVS